MIGFIIKENITNVCKRCIIISFRITSHFVKEPATDNVNITIFPIGDRLYTATDSKLMHRIDPETLESMGKVWFTHIYIYLSTIIDLMQFIVDIYSYLIL